MPFVVLAYDVLRLMTVVKGSAARDQMFSTRMFLLIFLRRDLRANMRTRVRGGCEP